MSEERTQQVAVNRLSVTVGAFFRAGRERLRLEVVSPNGRMDRVLGEPMVYRPGLALTGFYSHFASERIQVVGMVEHAYLSTLSPELRKQRITEIFSLNIPCMVFCLKLEVFPEVLIAAEEHGTVILQTDMLTRDFTHAAAFVLEELDAPRCRVYGTMIEVAGMGVLIEGAPGIGKSETALGLIKRGYALVADDVTELMRDASGKLMARAAEITRNLMEIRGIGIINVPSVFGVTSIRGEKQLDFVVTLKRQKETDGELDRTGADKLHRVFLGVDVPQLIIPVAPGRDLVNLVETAAQEHILRASGYDAREALEQQIKTYQEKQQEVK